MAGYIGTKAALLSTTTASVGGDSAVGGDLTVDTDTLYVDSANNRVGIGTSSPAHLVDAINTAESATARFGSTYNVGENNGTVIIGNGGTGDAMLRFDYEGTNTDRARIGVTSSGQQLEFYTAGDNERMRIRADGAVLINRTTQVAGGQVCIDYTNGVTAGMAIKDTNTSGTGVPLQVVNGSGSIVGSITQNQSSTAFNTSSDYRLKTDAQPMTGASARVQALNPVNFEWIADGTRVDGFLAHEAQEVVPEAVTGTKDAVDADGNPEYQGIDQSKLVPLLTAALQEALTKIDALETRITALEAV